MVPHEPAIVTDSAASLPPEQVAALGIIVVPFTLVLGTTLYADNRISTEEVARRSAIESLSTSAPSPGEWLSAMRSCGGRRVVAITVSATVSASFQSALMATRSLPPGQVAVVDSRTAAGAQGLVVAAAARAAAAGVGFDRVVTEAERASADARFIGCIEQFDALARSGRVPGVAAWAGRSLGLIPVFEFRSGAARPRRPAINPDRALSRLVEACTRGCNSSLHCLEATVMEVGATKIATELYARLQSRFPAAHITSCAVSSVVVAHTGLGVWGVAWRWTP